jgi:hypothetical protein
MHDPESELRRIPILRTPVHKEQPFAVHPRFMAVRYTTKMTDSKLPEQRGKQGQEKWYGRMRYQILLFTGGIALFVLVGGWILDWYIAPHTSAQKMDLIQALGLITAGVAGAVGIFFTWRGQRLTQESLEDTRKNTQENLRVTREGQITDRFTRAIDQLGKVDDKGNKLFEIRVGGIYALQRIARESDEDYWPIMEILTTYVRAHAPWPPEGDQQAEMDATVKKLFEEDAPVKKLFEKDTSEESEGIKVPALAPDVQAIMTVLRRRTRSFGHGEPKPLDLRKTHLSLADLSGVNLHRANLYRTNLRNADLSHADLSHADLSGANLVEADLSDADLSGANLHSAALSGANLSGANLSGASLSRAFLWETDLSDADLSGANLHSAALRRARLCSAHFDGASLRRADLEEADLSGADLSLTAMLSDAQLERTYGDEDTKLPPYLKPPAHWGVNTDEPTEED